MTDVQFIGTGDAFCSGGRRNSAILVRDATACLLLDCGPTTLLGLQQLGIDSRDIDAIAISHFHGDHALGVPQMLLDYLFEHPRTRPLEILGPPGIQDVVKRSMDVAHFEFGIEPRYALTYREFVQGAKLETGRFTIVPVPAWHHPETRPHMLAVATAGHSLFFTGDTGWHDSLPSHVGDVDLLITECTLLEDGFEYHISHERLVRERARFDCRRIVLTHLGRDVVANVDDVELETADDGYAIALR
jgi:ribonuclease BN (tRNA processing enzyme)